VVPQKKGRKKKAVRATPRSIESAERTARALELRKGGATYAMIGADLGVSEARAHQIVNDALTAIVAEPAEKVRKLEIERLDHMLSVIWPTATNAMSEVTTVDASLLDMILKANPFGRRAQRHPRGAERRRWEAQGVCGTRSMW
jgi:anti-sigma factor RsiW